MSGPDSSASSRSSATTPPPSNHFVTAEMCVMSGPDSSASSRLQHRARCYVRYERPRQQRQQPQHHTAPFNTLSTLICALGLLLLRLWLRRET
jgi:hypothetical protein